MKALFKNTSLSMFTPERQIQLNNSLVVLNDYFDELGLDTSDDYLGNVIMHLVYEDKGKVPDLFSCVDVLWALGNDGVNLRQVMNARGGFLYDFHNESVIHEENRFSPLKLLSDLGLAYIATQVRFIMPEHKSATAKELAHHLLQDSEEIRYEKRIDFLSKLNHYRLGLFAGYIINENPWQDEQLFIRLAQSLPYSSKLSVDDIAGFTSIYHKVIKMLDHDFVKDHANQAIAYNFIQSMVYDQVAGMKLTGCYNQDIIEACEELSDIILDGIDIHDNNRTICHRYMMINACMPFPDLLVMINASNHELSCGMKLTDQKFYYFEKYFVSANVNFLFGSWREPMAKWIDESLTASGFTISFKDACNNPDTNKITIRNLIERENGYPHELDSILDQAYISENLFQTLVLELDLSKASPAVLFKYTLHILNFLEIQPAYLGKFQKFWDNCDKLNGHEWKSILVRHLEDNGSLTPQVCQKLKLNRASLADIKNQTPAIKRALLSEDLGLDF